MGNLRLCRLCPFRLRRKHPLSRLQTLWNRLQLRRLLNLFLSPLKMQAQTKVLRHQLSFPKGWGTLTSLSWMNRANLSSSAHKIRQTLWSVLIRFGVRKVLAPLHLERMDAAPAIQLLLIFSQPCNLIRKAFRRTALSFLKKLRDWDL